jgi:hypothetical protein
VKDAFEQKSVEKPLVEFTTEESEEKPSFVAPNDEELDLGKEIFLSNLQENSQVVTETDNFDAVDEIATSSSLNADDLPSAPFWPLWKKLLSLRRLPSLLISPTSSTSFRCQTMKSC